MPLATVDSNDNSSLFGGKNNVAEFVVSIIVILITSWPSVYAQKSESRPLMILEHTDWVNCLAYSPDGEQIATCCDDGFTRLWDTANGKELVRCDRSGKRPMRLAWNPDGKSIAVSDIDGMITVYHTKDGKVKLAWQAHASSLSYNPNGKRLASGGRDGRTVLCIWDSETGKILLKPKVLDSASPEAEVCYSKDGKNVAWLSDSLEIIDATTGRKLIQCEGKPVAPLAYCSNQLLLASTMRADVPPDGALWYWNTLLSR